MAERDIWDQIEALAPGGDLGEEMFEFLSAYADGECTAKETKLVEAYLAQSPEARATLAEIRAAGKVIADDCGEPPRWLHESIASKTFQRRKTVLWPTAAFGAAAACGLGFWLMRLSVSPTSVGAPLASMAPVPLPAAVQPSDGQVATHQPTTLGVRAKPRGRSGARVLLVSNEPTPVAEEVRSETKAPPITNAPGKHVALTYALADYNTTLAKPASAPDTVSLVTTVEERPEETPKTASEASPKAEDPIMPDARERLREKLRKLNESKSDIKEAVKSSTS
jgi:hypothetical protein